MAAYLNFAALSTAELNSDALGPLDSLAHPLSPGGYFGAFFRKGERQGSFEIKIATEGTGDQIEIDFAVLERDPASEPFTCGAAKGQNPFVVFHTSGEKAGYHVVLTPNTKGARGYDSRRLEAGDYYIVTPVRPGRYQATAGKAREPATLAVAPAKPDGKPRASAAGAMLRVTTGGIHPKAAQLVSGDGAVFEIKEDGTVVHLLRDPDKSKPKSRRKVGARVHGRAIRDGLKVPKTG